MRNLTQFVPKRALIHVKRGFRCFISVLEGFYISTSLVKNWYGINKNKFICIFFGGKKKNSIIPSNYRKILSNHKCILKSPGPKWKKKWGKWISTAWILLVDHRDGSYCRVRLIWQFCNNMETEIRLRTILPTAKTNCSDRFPTGKPSRASEKDLLGTADRWPQKP